MKWHSFFEVVTDATSKFTKIKASDYHAHGRYKIIDQGKGPIAGYTDDSNLVNGQLLPILIFGDHTRVLKYEDDPIALGADGAKALWVNPDLANARYVYYYLRSIQIKEAGYSRHFKFLKELEIPIPFKDGAPDFDDQIRIAHLLGKVEGLIAQRKQHLQQLDDLLKSVFLEMFGDPVRNEKGWGEPDFGAIISGMRNGLSPSKTGAHKGRVYTLSAITGNRFQEIYKDDTFSQIHEKYYPMPSDFLLCRGNGNLGMVGKGYFFPGISEGVIFPDTIIAVSMRAEAVNKSFFEALWKTRFIRQQIESNARTTNGAHKINQGVIEKLRIIQPPIELQNQFSVIVKKIDGIKSRYQKSLTDLENLYGALSQQAFKGELDLSRVPLPGIQHQEEKIVAAEPLSPRAEQGFAINLPDTDHLLDALENAEARAALILQWLEAYRGQLGSTPFSVPHFMAAAQTRLAELHPDTDFELGANDYEHIKTWMFEALADGRLKQARDITGHDESGEEILGNLVEIKSGARP